MKNRNFEKVNGKNIFKIERSMKKRLKTELNKKKKYIYLEKIENR
jgi:hypothetical protein